MFFAERPASLSLSETMGRPDTTEIGSNSVSYGTGPGTARRLLDSEYLWELRGYNAYRRYDQMRFSDPKIAGLRFAQVLPLLRAETHIDSVDAEDNEAVAKADLVRRLLIDEYPWRAFLADTTLAEDYGYAPFEICWDTSSGEARCRLAYRPPSSILTENIYVVGGAVDHITQTPIDGGERDIPGEKLVWFCHGKEGDDFTGRSILRPMYKPWRLKCEQEMQLAVNIGKASGVPIFTVPDTLTDEERASLAAAGENFGIAEGAFLIVPEGVEHDFVLGGAKVSEILEAIKYWDSQITEVAQAQVRDLGIGQVGSRALGTTLMDMFTDSIQSMASYREDVLNANGGLIHQLVDNNFANDGLRPVLRFGNVQRADMLAMARALQSLSLAGMTIDEETWDWVRSELNMPKGTVQVVVPSIPAAPQPSGQGTGARGGTTPTETPADATGAKASEDHAHGLRLAERAPRGVEVYLNLAEIKGRFDNAKTAIREVTQATRDALGAELARRALAAAGKGQLAKFAVGAPPMIDKLTSEITAVLSNFYQAGQAQVADELQRQRDGKPWSPDSVGARVKAAEPPKPSAANLAVLKQQAEMAARSIANATQQAAAQAAARTAASIPITEPVLETAIARESDAAALRMAGTVSDVMSLGRTAEMFFQATDIADYVYSAILDGAACDECLGQDGEETTDGDVAEGWAPNPSCSGGDRCRCLVVAEIAPDTGAPA